MLVQRKIKLLPSEVERFVSTASKCNFDIDIAYNRYLIDAKSLLGVYGLDLTKILTVSYSGYNAEFEELLSYHAQAV